MIRILLAALFLFLTAIAHIHAQQDRVIHFSYTLGEDSYYLSFEEGGGGDVVTRKMEKPGLDETFFLKYMGMDSLKRSLYLIASREGYLMRTDEDKQLVATGKEIKSNCFFRAIGNSEMTLFDGEGRVMQFSTAEKRFLMVEEIVMAGTSLEELQKAGLKIQSPDVPGGIEGGGMIKTFQEMDWSGEQQILLQDMDTKKLNIQLEKLKEHSIKLNNQIKHNR